ncbi:5'-nucleotidase C-terminal domain-containing protein [[Clostridium] polysaccharolyticum]|uniref:2',3'-cyclic-nucleotide 2'-phosphodiesterase / 3'-nucleotidase n=1 Tax=[Clostridium] polysaccharolyticum TaxID=29364 RepID=A0A1I0BE09_9FIRM|nr:5'-nucleotidase C-terminal domain-containing protein [[Clostridium] polysaccharolyticum]SET04421.1 2',3'-cyclic-nucleotide 2'-phosphodiesterase / 3'-nucleotidase [[Clostridium] polysaccharolyticum]
MKNFRTKAIAVILMFAMVFAGTGFQPSKVKAEANDSINLQILATSDLHGRFVPYDYAINTKDTSGSLAQVATAVYNNRNQNTILLDCGDIIQDNSADLFFNESIHPMIAGMNHLQYDAITLGNHEFNYGMDILKKVMKQSKAPVLGGNVYNPDGSGIAQKYTILERSGVKIAVIGMVTPNITRWDAANLKGYKVTDPVEETKKVIEQIKDKADVIVAAVHMGEKSEYGVKNSGTIDLANACPEIDVILASHEHKAVDGVYYNNVLTVENQYGGQTLAKVNLELKKGEDGKYKVTNRTSKLIVTKDYPADSQMELILDKYHQMAKEDANIVIGKLVGGDLVPANEISDICQAQLQETSMINLINKVQRYYTGAEVSGAACFNASANMKEGDIKKCDTALIYKYANTLYKLEMTGAQLKKYMEWCAAFYNTYQDGDLTISFNPDIRLYNNDMFSGVNYTINVAKEPGNRIENLTHENGKPVKDDEKIIVAVNNYRANSHLLTYGSVFKKGESLPKLLESDVHSEIGGVRELIGAYIKDVKKGVIRPELSGNWKITGNNWNEEFHQKAVELAAEGKLTIPRSEDGRDYNIKAVTKADIAPFVTIKKPAKVTKVKAKSKKAKTATISYQGVKYAKNYEIRYTADKKFKKGVKCVKTEKTSYTIKKLKSKTKYYVKVRAVKYDLNDKVLTGSCSSMVSVKVK